MSVQRLTRRQVLGGMAALSLTGTVTAVGTATAGPVITKKSKGDLEQWIDGYGPGLHVLKHVPTFADYKLKRDDPRFPDTLYAEAVASAWGRVGPSLGAWCGGAFRFPYFYTCSGGHADSGLDSIYRVDMATGAVAGPR